MTEKVLILRTSNKYHQSHGGFRWPESGPVEALDWDPIPQCGKGLHGALWGEGDGRLFDWTDDAIWQIVEVDADSVVDLNRKVKFPRGTVVFSGDRKEATNMILAHPDGKGRAVIGAEISMGHRGMVVAGYCGSVIVGNYGTATVGDGGKATAGAYGEATAGDHGTATAGSGGKATAGDHGTATAGSHGTATARDHGTATAEDHGIATAGIKGTATVGRWGKAIAGNYGKATAGFGGKATAGYRSTAIVGDCGIAAVEIHGMASAGHKGSIHIQWYDKTAERFRLSTGYIGENGLKPNTLYEVDKNGEFTKRKLEP